MSCCVASSFPQKYDYFPWLGFRPSQLLKRTVRRVHLLYAKLRAFDIVFVERELFNDESTEMEERFRKVARRMILDLDDAVFLRFPEKIERLVRMSDLVIAGNSWIANHIAGWNSNIVTIPTGIELARYSPRSSTNHVGRPIIGWMGTTGNLQYLEVVAPALRQLSRRCDFEFRVIVPELKLPDSVDLDGVRVNHVVWDSRDEVSQLSEVDIGIMPLFPDREWDKYKCPTKLTQYMALKIAPVASPVGFTGDVLTHEHDGLYAATTDEWESELERLILDVEFRTAIGEQARHTVAKKYCVEANWPILLEALKQVHEMK